MTDVRLTVTTEDGQVVPVAATDQGRLLLEDPLEFDGNLDGDLIVTGNGTFGAEDGSSLTIYQYDGNQNNNGIRLFSNGFNSFLSVQNKTQVPASGVAFNVLRGSTSVASVFNNGSATFTNDVAIGSRGSVWTIVESGGLAHLIELTDLQREGETLYPELRNIPRELDLIEQALGEVMDKLRMIPPAGWPVWDGSDENS